jgi:predicted secreted hydrolase
MRPASIPFTQKQGERMTKEKRRAPLLFAMVWIVGATCLAGCPRPAYDAPSTPLNFPADHGFHSNRTEWLYFSGVLQTEAGKELGFMFTVFQRESLISSLNKGFFYPCILAVSDPAASAYYSSVTLGVFGSSCFSDGLPSIEAEGGQIACLPSGDFHVQADMDGLSVDLTMKPDEDVLPHGEDGLIPMGDGIDSGYYSFTNLPTSGTVSIDGTDYAIASGRTWMDHQWGNWTESGMIWDWLSMRFDNGGSLMVFQFRDGSNNVVGGNWTYRDADGKVRYGTDFSVNAHRTYTDPESGDAFPVDWTVAIPSLEAEFRVTPALEGQNIYSLWEGLCAVEGTAGGAPLTGKAFVELTGYGDNSTSTRYALVLQMLLKSLWSAV